MVGQPGINCCSILDNFRKKALVAFGCGSFRTTAISRKIWDFVEFADF
jgi:hypothetical protein